MLKSLIATFIFCLEVVGFSSSAHADGSWNFDEAKTGQVFVSGSHSTCGGSVIGADLVLTAGHCITKLGSSASVSASDVTFTYTFPDGQTKIYKVINIAKHPDFVRESSPTREHIARDIALLRLSEYVPGPFEDMAGFRVDQPYIALLPTEQNAPMKGEPCAADYENDKIVVLSCARAKGSSGMPAYSLVDGKREITAVISANGSREGEPITFAVNPLEVIGSLEWVNTSKAKPSSY